ncbi:hypothetical protein VTN00DRAFT_3266 [Thermoascus crustaceus]|uniref:uncharacterized protein n=1 Tax=Thermoascus crustaceus TaxID=5088 RepID=UPI0037432CC0
MAESTPGVDKVPNRGPLFMIASSTLTAFACALVFFRMSSTVKRKVVGIEDVLVGFSAVCQIVNHTVGSLAVHYGFGRHRADINRSGGNIVHALLYFYLFQVFYKFVLCLNKLSFLFLYMRLFPTPKFRIVCLASIVIVAGGTLGFVVATIMQCIPIEKYWERPLTGHCVNNMAFRWSWAPFNTILDIWVCLMPLPVIRRLQMDTLKKAGIMLLFVLGLFVCVTSIIRMEALVDSTTTRDATWGSFMALLWSSIEASTGIARKPGAVGIASVPAQAQRLSRWGEAVDIYRDPKLGNPNATPAEIQTAKDRLFQILVLFANTEKIPKRYKLGAKAYGDLSVCSTTDMDPVVMALNNKMKELATKRQNGTSFLKVTSWALYDASQFDNLIQKVTAHIDGLENCGRYALLPN